MTNTTQTSLTWTAPELLAHGLVTAAKDNAIAIVRENGLEVSNATVSAVCAEAIDHFSKLASVSAAGWIRAYGLVRQALGVAS